MGQPRHPRPFGQAGRRRGQRQFEVGGTDRRRQLQHQAAGQRRDQRPRADQTERRAGLQPADDRDVVDGPQTSQPRRRGVVSGEQMAGRAAVCDQRRVPRHRPDAEGHLVGIRMGRATFPQPDARSAGVDGVEQRRPSTEVLRRGRMGDDEASFDVRGSIGQGPGAAATRPAGSNGLHRPGHHGGESGDRHHDRHQ